LTTPRRAQREKGDADHPFAGLAGFLKMF